MTAANMVVNPTDVLVIDETESNLGTDGYSCFNPAMHGSYLGPISGCGVKDYAQEDYYEELCGDLFACCNEITDQDHFAGV